MITGISVKSHDITNDHVIMRFPKTFLDSPVDSSEDGITELL